MDFNQEINTSEKYAELDARKNRDIERLNNIYNSPEEIDDSVNVPRETSVDENENVSRETSVDENENVSRETFLENENEDLNNIAKFLRSADLKPEEESKKAKLENELNLDRKIFNEEIEDKQKQLLIENLQSLKPDTQQFLLDNERFASYVYDDVPNLKNSETFFDWVKLASVDIFKAGRAGFLQSAELADLEGTYAITKELTPENEKRAKQIQAYQEEIHNAKTWLGRASSPFVHMSAMIAGMMPEALNTGFAGGFLGAIAGSAAGPVGTFAGFTAGFTIGVSASLAKQIFYAEGGSAFTRAVDLGVDKDTAQKTAAIVGITNTALGMFSHRLVSNAIMKPIIHRLTERYAEKVAITTAWGRGVDFVRHAGMYTIGETGVNVMQATVQHIGQETSILSSITDQDQLLAIENRPTLLQEIYTTADYTYKAVIGFGVIGASVRYRNQVAYLKTVDDAFKLREEQILRSQDSKVRERDVKASQAILNHLADGEHTRWYYITAEKLQEVMTELGITEKDFQENLPNVAKQIKDALQVDDINVDVTENGADIDIKISAGEFYSLPPEFSTALNEHVRGEQDGLSPSEAKEFDVKKAEKKAKELEEKEKEERRQSVKVKKDILKKIKRTGLYDDKANQTLATMMHTFFEVQSKEADIAIEEFYNLVAPIILSRFQKVLSGGIDAFVPYQVGVRGSYYDSVNMIFLESHAPVETFVHEAGHYFFQMLTMLAEKNLATESMKAHVQSYLDLFIVNSVEEFNALPEYAWVEIHENFAYSFTKYMLDGKAPTPELAPLYRTLSRYISSLYRNFESLNDQFYTQVGENIINYSPELVQVMDRLLASQEAIDAVEANGGIYAMFGSAEEAGVSPEQWAEYEKQRDEATNRAVEILTAKSLEAMQWLSKAQNKELKRLQTKNRKLRAKIKAEITAEVEKMHVYVMLEEFKNNPAIRIDTSDVRSEVSTAYMGLKRDEYYTKAMRRLIAKKITSKDGLPLKVVAENFGYKKPKQLLYDVIMAKNKQDIIREMTDNKMLEHHDNIKTQEQIDNIINTAVHNKARSKFIATELSWLRKETGKPVRIYQARAKQVAINKIGKMSINAVNATMFAKQAQRYSTLAENARMKGKTEEAIKYKNMELLYNEMVKEGIRIADEKARLKDIVKKFNLPDKTIASFGYGRDIDKVNQGRLLLMELGLYDPKKHGYASSEDFFQRVMERRSSVIFDDFIKVNNKAITLMKKYGEFKKFSTDEYVATLNILSGLWQLAKRDRQIRLGQRKESLAKIQKQMIETLRNNNQHKDFDARLRTDKEVAKNKLLNFLYYFTRAEHFLAHLDTYGTEGGIFTELFRMVKTATSTYKVDRDYHTKIIADAFQTLPEYNGTIDASILQPGLVFKSKAEVIGIILHMGNDSNMTRLIEGYGWGKVVDGKVDKTKLISFFNQLIEKEIITKADMDFVQLSWDTINTIKDRTQQAHYEMTGFYFKEIDPVEIRTPWGDYKGGYVPLSPAKNSIKKPKANKVPESIIQDTLGQLQGEFVENMPHNYIYSGHTKERQGTNYAVSLDIETLVSRHIDKALKYALLLPAVKDVLKVFDNDDLRHTLEVTNPGAYDGIIIPWLTNAAKQVITEKGIPIVDDLVNYVRRNATYFYLTGNVKNIVQQLTGATVGFHDVQGKHLKGAWKQIKQKGYGETNAMVVAKSAEMYDRMENGFRHFTDLIKNKIRDFNGVGLTDSKGDLNPLHLQHLTQSMVDTYLWVAKYNETYDRKHNHVTEEDAKVLAKMTDAELEVEAVNRADALVRKSQDSYGADDKAKFQIGTPFIQSLIQFSSYLNSTNNYTLFRLVQAGRDLTGTARYKAIMQALCFMYLMPAVLDKSVEVALNKHFKLDDDETFADVFADTIISGIGDYTLGGIPGIRGFVDIIFRNIFKKNKSSSAKLGSSPAYQMVEDGILAVSDGYDRFTNEDNKGGIPSRRKSKQYMALLSLLLGRHAWIAGGLSKPLSYEAGRQNDEVELDTFLDYFGYITGKPREESEKNDN